MKLSAVRKMCWLKLSFLVENDLKLDLLKRNFCSKTKKIQILNLFPREHGMVKKTHLTLLSLQGLYFFMCGPTYFAVVFSNSVRNRMTDKTFQSMPLNGCVWFSLVGIIITTVRICEHNYTEMQLLLQWQIINASVCRISPTHIGSLTFLKGGK